MVFFGFANKNDIDGRIESGPRNENASEKMIRLFVFLNYSILKFVWEHSNGLCALMSIVRIRGDFVSGTLSSVCLKKSREFIGIEQS